MQDLLAYPRMDELPLDLKLWLVPAPVTRHGAEARLAQSGGEDQGTGAVYGSDGSGLPALGPLAHFGSWASVASTIMTAVRNLSFFGSASPLYFAEPWFWFPIKFRLCPFWSANFHSDHRYVSISKLSLKPALDAVVDFVRELGTPALVNEVTNSVKKIGELAVQNRGSTQKDNHQQLGVIAVRSARVYVVCFRISISMEYKSGKGYEQLNQTISLQRSYGILDYSRCIEQASVIDYMDRAPIDDWARDISSGGYRPNQSPAWSV